MPSFDALSEVIVYAQDVGQLASFYTDALGLEITRGNPEHGFVAFATGDCQLCLHAGGDGDFGASAPKFVFEVDDLEAARSHLLDHDIELGDVRSPAPGVEICDGRDPEGNRFSIESSVASEQ